MRIDDVYGDRLCKEEALGAVALWLMTGQVHHYLHSAMWHIHKHIRYHGLIETFSNDEPIPF